MGVSMHLGCSIKILSHKQLFMFRMLELILCAVFNIPERLLTDCRSVSILLHVVYFIKLTDQLHDGKNCGRTASHVDIVVTNYNMKKSLLQTNSIFKYAREKVQHTHHCKENKFGKIAIINGWKKYETYIINLKLGCRCQSSQQCILTRSLHPVVQVKS